MSADRPRITDADPAGGDGGKSPPAGRLFILSAPSGAGKSTLCTMLRDRLPDLRYSISYTTRPPRPGESDGVDYFFIDETTFQKGIADGRWVEWARVHDHYYGTSSAFIDSMLAQGQDLLLDIDVQGAAQLVEIYPGAVTIFIMPPSMEVLRRRLEKRGTDETGVIVARLRNAEVEMAARSRYRHVVVNDRIEQAVNDLLDILAPLGGAAEPKPDHGI